MGLEFERRRRYKFEVGSTETGAGFALEILRRLDTIVAVLSRFYQDGSLFAITNVLTRYVIPNHVLIPMFGILRIDGEGGVVGYCRFETCYSDIELPKDLDTRLRDSIFTFLVLLLDTMPSEVVDHHRQLVENISKVAEDLAGSGAVLDFNLLNLIERVLGLIRHRKYEVDVTPRIAELVERLAKLAGGGDYVNVSYKHSTDEYYLIISAGIAWGNVVEELSIDIFPRYRSEINVITVRAGTCGDGRLCMRISFNVNPSPPTKSLAKYVENVENVAGNWVDVISSTVSDVLTSEQVPVSGRMLAELVLEVVGSLSTSSSRP